MPELPETETIARDLDSDIRGSVIRDVVVHKSDVLRECTPASLKRVLLGARITRVWRRAKLIVLDCHAANDKLWHIVVQPRFTGGLLVDDGTLPESAMDYLTVTWVFEDERQLHYRDVRRLGTVALMSEARFEEYQSALGPEPLDHTFDVAKFSESLRDSRQPVKVFLMDQRRLAGVGNIYANEALWRAQLDPSREARTLHDTDVFRLFDALQSVLRESIAARGTSFRDYRDARGERGRFVAQLAVYGRAGQPCLRCGRKLVGTHAVDGRSTVFCATCQR